MSVDKSIRLSYVPANGELILHAGNRKVFAHPVLAVTLRRLSATYNENVCSLIVPQDGLSEVYRQLGQTVQRAGYELVEDSLVADEISHVKEREEDFKIFSEKAAEIWSGQAVPAELAGFEEIISKKIKRKLTDLQFLSALHLAFSQNACNFSVPGAGKTTIVYSAFAYLNGLPANHKKHIDRILVIGPLASFYAWRREFKECFGRDPLVVRLFAGMPKREIDDVLLGLSSKYRDLELIHVSLQSSANYEEKITHYLSTPDVRTMLVIDEAHNIKREDGVWASSCIRLAPFAGARVILTGTPAPNGYEDLYNLFRFLYPERNLIGFPRANLVAMSQGMMPSEPMRQRIKPFFTRITKAHLGLPPFEENRVLVQMTAAERKIYDDLEVLLMPSLSRRERGAANPMQKAALIRLRQAASNPLMLLRPLERDCIDEDIAEDSRLAMTVAESLREFDGIKSSNKLNMLLEICAEKIGRGEKILVWSYFISTIDMIEMALKNLYGGGVVRITGSTPSEGDVETSDEILFTREQIITGFMDDPGVKILIANPQALGESVSLHYSCHTAIYFDRDFNCGRFIQSKDRIHRYGLPPDVSTHYYFLTYADTVDVDIHERLISKESRMNSLVERDEIPLFSGIDDEAGQFDDIRQVLKSYAARKIL